MVLSQATIVNTWGVPISFDADTGVSFEKGDLLWFGDARKVSGASTAGAPFAGVVATEKVAAEAAGKVGVWRSGVFDIYAGAPITAGDYVYLSGQNMVYSAAVIAPTATGVKYLSGSMIVGIALETASAAEQINVLVGAV